MTGYDVIAKFMIIAVAFSLGAGGGASITGGAFLPCAIIVFTACCVLGLLIIFASALIAAILAFVA